MERHNTVDEYIEAHEPWRDGLILLRKILVSTGMEETVKWGGPCYTVNGRNVVGLGAFKGFFTLWFFQGALLQDKHKVLISAQEGTTKALRQWRFTSVKELNQKMVRAYLREAIENQENNREIKADRSKPVIVPPELLDALKKNSKAAACFDELTKGRRREYADYIADAARSETKLKRLDKILPMIMEKKGLNDHYRRC